MRILIHDYTGYPFPFSLSKELAKRGHHVLHAYTCSSGAPNAGFGFAANASLCVRNILAENVKKERFLHRRAQESKYGDKVVTLLSEWRPHIVMSADTPLEAQRKIVRWTKHHKVPFVFWMQDIISVATKSILTERLGPLGFLVSLYFRRIEQKALSNSNHIVLISESFMPILKDWGINIENITVIPNWAPIEDMPLMEKANDFSIQNGIADRFVVLYSGTLGMKHDPGIILRAAAALHDHQEIVFVVVSEGSGAEFLKDSKINQGLQNLLILPFQPYEAFPQVLASADVLFTILKPSASKFSVPSKVWSGFCAARPSILVVPKANLAARVAEAAEAGIVISEEQLVSSIKRLKINPDECSRMGRNARQYAETHFRIDHIADRFESIFEKISGNVDKEF